MLIILHKMSQDILDQTESDSNKSALEQSVDISQNNNTGKYTDSENNIGEAMKYDIEEKNKKNPEKKGKKNPVKKIRIKRDLTNQKIISINSYNNEINKKRKRSKRNSKKIKNKFSYYFKKKSRNKIKLKKILYQEKSNNFGGSIISSLTDLNEGSPGQEKKLKFDNEIIDCLFVGVEEEEYDFYNIEIISSINFNKDYQT